MDCDNALELLADRDGRTLTGVESAHLSQHIRACDSCCEAAGEGEPAMWKLDDDAVAGPGGLVLPTIDPELYEVEGSVARGGMGRIVRARDRRLRRGVHRRAGANRVRLSRASEPARYPLGLSLPEPRLRSIA